MAECLKEKDLDNFPDEFDDVDVSEESDEDPDDQSKCSSFCTDIEQSFDSDIENNGDCDQNNNNKIFIGKNGTEWSSEVSNQKKKVGKHNICIRLPNVKRAAQDRKSIFECWQLFFTKPMIEEIVYCTNIKLETSKVSYKNSSQIRLTTYDEICAMFGLLYLIGVKKASQVNLRELWSTDRTSADCFRAVMSEQRFSLLLACLRFDNIHDREKRKKIDNLAAIRKFYECFNENCKVNYSPGTYLTIDEMLEKFKGRCKFRQYIPNKPAKYGIKFFSLVDSRTYYTQNLEIYAGKQPSGTYEQSNSAFDVVKRLAQPILGTGRNLTFDNYFTSIPLVEDLLNNHNTTCVGTIRSNKRELPPELTNIKKRPVRSSQFVFNNNMTLVSYVPKKNTDVLLISTMHHDNAIDQETGSDMKPEILTFYNLTKGGVDELKSNYNVARGTHRWPMVVFYSFFNIAGINAQIIYMNNNGVKCTRREFLKILSTELFQPHLILRSQLINLSTGLRDVIMKVGNIRVVNKVNETDKEATRQYCTYCPKKNGIKSKKTCSQCSCPICPKHTVLLCLECKDKVDYK